MSGVNTPGGPVSFFEERRPSAQLVQRMRWGSLGVGALLILVLPWLWWSFALVGGVVLFFQWWLWSTRFIVRLEEEALTLRLAPFPGKRIPLEEIKGTSTHMSYPWGIGKRGWSIQKSPGVTVYFTDPGAGLVLELENGQAVWFNSPQAEKLAAMLKPRKRRKKAAPQG
ncbi:MAG: hypothetical protein ACPG31_06015 [Planctomycetota bacterium]